MLKIISEKLSKLGIRSHLKLRWHAGDVRTKSNGEKIVSKRDGYIIEITDKESILKLLQNLNIRHEEKVMKKNLMLTNLCKLQ